MKKIFSILLFFIITFSLCSCSNSNKMTALNMDYSVSDEILEINNLNNLSDETIKALSVVIRTQLSNGLKNEDLLYKNISETNDNNDDINDKSENDNLYDDEMKEKIYNLVNQTKGETIKTQNLKNIKYIDNSNNFNWQIKINKSELLEFLNKKNINLTNISDIEPYYNNNNELSYIKIGGKTISYNELKSNFNLNSPFITKIDTDSSSITIYGNSFDEDIFDIHTANNLSKNSHNYKELLKYFFNNSNLKTI